MAKIKIITIEENKNADYGEQEQYIAQNEATSSGTFMHAARVI